MVIGVGQALRDGASQLPIFVPDHEPPVSPANANLYKTLLLLCSRK